MKMIYLIFNFIEFFGTKILDLIIEFGNAIFFIKSIFTKKKMPKNNIKEFIKQLYFIGFLSLGIILLSGFFIGMVVGLQGYSILKKFGTEEVIGQMTALTIIRELGPVVSALLFAGRTGASLTAEICLMKSTEQLASMEMMGIDPIKKIIMPRFFAGILSMVVLSSIFVFIAILGSYMSTVLWLDVDGGAFWNNIKENVNFRVDILNSFVKSIIFGFLITWISVFQGFKSDSTTSGIAFATTNSVVYSSFAILGLNFFLTAIMFRE